MQSQRAIHFGALQTWSKQDEAEEYGKYLDNTEIVYADEMQVQLIVLLDAWTQTRTIHDQD